MSIEALSWAFNIELPSSGAKLTLLALANYSNESGEAFPSQKAMAQKTCLCERAIRTHLVTLEELGIITRVSRTRANGSFTTDLFKLNIGAVASGKICQRQNLPTAENDTSQRQILPNPAAEYAAPEPSLTTTITKNNPSLVIDESKAKPVKAKRNHSLPDDYAPKQTHWKLAVSLGVDLNAEIDQFRDHHNAKGSTMASWDSALNTWIRNSAKWSKQAKRSTQFLTAQQQRDENNRRSTAEFLADDSPFFSQNETIEGEFTNA